MFGTIAACADEGNRLPGCRHDFRQAVRPFDPGRPSRLWTVSRASALSLRLCRRFGFPPEHRDRQLPEQLRERDLGSKTVQRIPLEIHHAVKILRARPGPAALRYRRELFWHHRNRGITAMTPRKRNDMVA